MKNKFYYLLLAILLVTSCKKDEQPLVLTVGNSYHYKGNIFNEGAFKPNQPLRLDSLYVDPGTGLPFATLSGSIDWIHFATKSGGGVAQMTVDGNIITLQNLEHQGIKQNDNTIIKWEFPQKDLEK